MSTPVSSQRSHDPHTTLALFGGMLFVFTLAYGIVAVSEAYWRDASSWVVLVYAVQCLVILLCIAWAVRSRAGEQAALLMGYGLVALHFAVFGLVRLYLVTPPEGLLQAVLVSRVLFYFASASAGYCLACVVFFKHRREVGFASILPGAMLLGGAWYVLRDAIDSNQVVTSFGMSLALVVVGIALHEFSRIEAVRRLFSNRPKNEMASELQQAKRVHESMFPEPVVADGFRFGYAYRPMRQIGGDFIHLYPDEPGRDRQGVFYLTLIDVTGHGITSALTVNRLHAELQQYFASAQRPSPSAALSYLNDYVRLTMAEHGLFATGVCVEVDTKVSTLTIANAGHPYCYYRGASGLAEVKAEGPMLGVFPEEAFDAIPQSLRVSAGDQLVMVTDGAIESSNPAGEQIGTERLRQMIDRSCVQTAAPESPKSTPSDQATGTESLLQRRMTARLLDRADVRKPVGLIQQVLRQRMNAHPCALADEIMLSIDDFVQQDSQDDILIATIELLNVEVASASSEAAE